MMHSLGNTILCQSYNRGCERPRSINRKLAVILGREDIYLYHVLLVIAEKLVGNTIPLIGVETMIASSSILSIVILQELKKYG